MIIYKSSKGITDIDESKGVIKGVGSVFGNIDSDGDVMMKGAFTKTLSEQDHKKRIKYLYQHRTDQVIGKFNELSQNDNQLDFVAQLAIKASLAKDVFELIKADVITENSVGFETIKQGLNKEEGYNEIKEVKLYEISAVTFAANPLAVMQGFKSTDQSTKNEQIKEYLNQRFESLEKLVKSNITDELGLAAEFEIKSLRDIALNGFTEPIEIEDNHSAEDEARRQSDDVYNYLLKNL